ncbi:bifunctional UDP-sugar hydrolase/5'-nucleotidase [Pedobacter gandavensis]|uniref:Bifunctional metallophosphatase/5'-nucleotidase n=1 Tax=Pedobacter gandavensis TaxID=2679963 RepID=A0ABR6ETR8_9SPHI|nr:hypothetical protein [Pedobacter gandavensis]MBB2148668.1 hypothetical protein [Pedobacter gandavensis]
MELKRRSFLRKASIFAGTAFIAKPLSAIAGVNKTLNTFANAQTVTVFHSGNLNGCIESNRQNLGGLRELSQLIKRQETAGLMVDAGSFLGQTDGKEVVSMMNRTGYHAANIGAAELRNGEEALAALLPYMDFPLVNCNYDFNNAQLSSAVKSHVIIRSGNLKVGITGLGKEIAGIGFKNPYQSLNKTAEFLKVKEGCDLVICLSNLDPEDKTYNNNNLAEKSAYVDLIVGKNGQKVSKGVMIRRNSNREEVAISQVGYDGVIVGKTSFSWDVTQGTKNDFQHNFLVAGLPMNNNSKQANLILTKMSKVKLS